MPAIGLLLKRGAGLLWNFAKSKARGAVVSGAQKAGEGIGSALNAFQPNQRTGEEQYQRQRSVFSLSEALPFARAFSGKDASFWAGLFAVGVALIPLFLNLFYSTVNSPFVDMSP